MVRAQKKPSWLARAWGRIKHVFNNRHRYLQAAQQGLDTVHRVVDALPQGQLHDRAQQLVHHADRGMHYARRGVDVVDRVHDAVSGSGSGH